MTFTVGSASKRLFEPQHFFLQLSRKFLAVGASLPKLGETDRCANRPLAQQVDQVRHECHVLPVTDFFAHVAMAEFVGNQARRQRVNLPRRRFEQRRFEWQNSLAT